MADKNQLEKLLHQLQRQKQALLELEKTSEDSSKTVLLDQSRVGRLTRMDALQGQAMSIEAKRRRRLQISKIDAALKRLEQNEYGYCLSCDEEIALARLELDPATTLCIECANKAEL